MAGVLAAGVDATMMSGTRSPSQRCCSSAHGRGTAPAWHGVVRRSRAFRGRSFRREVARSVQEPGSPEPTPREIENLSQDYCDDFVCNSSPAVEQSVRRLARNIERLIWAKADFAPGARYKDAFRRFEGSDKYERLVHLKNSCENFRVSIKRIEMVEIDTAVIEWSFTGDYVAGPLNLDFTSTFEMNVITGRVEEHNEAWKAAGFPSASALLYNANRLAWSISEAGVDAISFVQALGERDEEGGEESYYVDPADPRKYIQQDNSLMDDALQFGIALTLLYTLVQVLKAVL